MKRHLPRSRASDFRAALAAFVATLLALPVNAATTFPDYPLQTGVGSIPPNIMFILDNSGSMGLISMPTTTEAFDAEPFDYYGTATGRTQVGLRDNPHDRSYLNNAIYYDPTVPPYQPWLTADGVTRRSGGTTVDAVYKNWSLASGDTRDLRGSDESIFYVPKKGVTASTDPSDFDRYRINSSGVVVVSPTPTRVSGFPKGPLDWSMDPQTQRTFTITVPAGTSTLLVTTSGGGRGVELNLLDPDGDRRCSSSDGNGGESCSETEPEAGSWTVQVYRDEGSTFSNATLDAFLFGPEVAQTPTGRTQGAELTNIATWYSYYRSRMKTAKAGAFEAFAGLSRNYRVGYTPINGRSSDLGASGTNPIIPVTTNDGLFESANKTAWFKSIFDAQTENGSTPLRGALDAVGKYYTRADANGPWGAQAAADQLSCRQSFAILTTDGYWNDSADSTFGLGDEDGDGHSVTLADIAAYYYNTDLRTGLANNVPVSTSDPADWQHMVTFGISIGLSGTLPQTSPPPASNAALWPNPMDGEDAERIDDLWHAAVNGKGTFIAAANAGQFARALKKALNNIDARDASGSNVTSNGPQLNTGSRIYQATFRSGEWYGNVESISIGDGSIASTSEWSVAEVADDNPAAFLDRGVYTWNGADGAGFPTDAQKGYLGRVGGAAPVTADENAAYIKGDRSKEGVDEGDLRKRTFPIGDIVNSSPFYSEEAAALFIGANDGMMHAINSANGVVEFSYVPAGLDFSALATLSDPDYQHRFFVDGGIDVTTRAQGGDRNILVASLGRGGKGVFALDVTDPATFDDTDVLWDKTFNASASGDADMGYVLGAPLVRKGHTGTTLAFVGNGVDSANGSSTLFVYNAATGALVRKIVLDADGGGLAPPRAADTNLDGIADFLYAGDLSGNLWKLDIRDKSAGKWSSQKFFTAVGPDGAQPITAAVAIAREPVTERIFVMFGTGQYVSNGDLTDVSTQTLYALIDEGTAISGRDELHERTIPFTGKDSLGRDARAWESYSELPADANGWYVDLGIPTAGERVVTAPFMRGRALWFSSIIPQAGTGCDSGGTGYLNALDGFTGTNPELGGGTGTYIDVDGDGEGDDKLKDASGDGEDQFITSVDLGVGMVGQGTGVGNAIYACGSEAECGLVKTPPDGSGAKRLGWRELYDRN